MTPLPWDRDRPVYEYVDCLCRPTDVDARVQTKRSEGWELVGQHPSRQYPGKLFLTFRRVKG